MSVARFIADQRTFYAVPHAFSCRLLEVSESWFYKWIKAPTTVRGQRRGLLDEAVRKAFAASGATFGSPRVYQDLIDPELPHPELAAIQDDRVVTLPVPTACQDEAVCDPTDEVPDQAGGQVVSGEAEASSADPAQGSDPLLDRASGCSLSNSTLVWRVSVNTVADSMRRQGLRGRQVKRNRGLTRQDRTAAKFPDLLKRDFTAAAANLRWVGDMTEIPTDQGKLRAAKLKLDRSQHVDSSIPCAINASDAAEHRPAPGQAGARRTRRPGHRPFCLVRRSSGASPMPADSA